MNLKTLTILFIFLLSLISVNSQTLTVDDTVAAYRFEEGSGTICLDSSINNLTGTLNGTTSFINSKGNNGTGDFATRYGGVDDFCQVLHDNLLNLTSTFSVSFWINKTDVATDDFIIYKNNQGTDSNYGITIDGSELVNVWQRVTGETARRQITSIAITTNEWVHIVAIINGTTATDAHIYFNAVKQATVDGTEFGVDSSDMDLYIGVDANLANDIDGDLDEIYIFNFSLTDTQITDLFENGLVIDPVRFNSTNLNVFQSKNPVEILEDFTLFANYTNATDNQPVLNAVCFANSSIVGGGQAGFGRGILGIGGLSTIDNAVHTQVIPIFGNMTVRVDIDNVPLSKASYAINYRYHAHNLTPLDDLRVFATCHPNNLTFSNFTLFDTVNISETVVSTSTLNDTVWGFRNAVLFGETVASPNCSIVFESRNSTETTSWMIADTTSNLNLNNSFFSLDFGETYIPNALAAERSPFVDAGFGLDVPNETTMTFNSTSGLYFLPNIRHGRPFDFEDRVFCSADQFQNATNFTVTNVQDNVPPIVQIVTLPPVAIFNVSNETIVWTANDPELLTKFINVSFPNGSLLIQSELQPLILTPVELTVLGNYSVIAFANDTGGLFSIANGTFEVALVDQTDPVITLVSPDNNTRTNIIPLNITFTVTDNTAINLICVLGNTTEQFDEGLFTVSTNSNLTLAEGFTILDQAFPNLNITCFDNSLANNSATLLLNYTLDTNPPIISIFSPVNNSIFNNNIVNSIQIAANCTDLPVFNLNITVSNSSDTIATFEDMSPVNNVVSIDDNLNILNLEGDFTVTYTCADPHTNERISDWNVRKNNSDYEIKYLTNGNEFRIKYLQNDLTVNSFGSRKSDSDDRYEFYFNTNITESSTEYTYIFEVLSRKVVHYFPDSKYKAHFITGNNWIDFELEDPKAEYVITKNSRGNYEVEVTTTLTNLNFKSTGELNIVTQFHNFNVFSSIMITDNIFDRRVCPVGSLSLVVMFIFMFILAFIIIALSFVIKSGDLIANGLMGTLGSILLLILSTFLYACILAVGIVMSGIAILLLSYFIFIGFNPRRF